MAYRRDVDLEFLQKATHEELKNLADLLIYDPKDGETRWTQELKSKLECRANYALAWEEIAGELQCFGANTFMTLFRRGKGVLYKEILCDCCDELKVNYNKDSSTATIEKRYLEKVLEKSWDEMPSEQKEEFLKNINAVRPERLIKITDFAGLASLLPLNEIIGYILGRTILAYSTTAGLALGSSLAYAGLGMGGMVIARIPTILNPLGWALNAYTVNQLAGPAYRVTIPACTIIAVLRSKYEISAEKAVQLEKYQRLVEKMEKQITHFRNAAKEMRETSLGYYAFCKTLIAKANSQKLEENFILFFPFLFNRNDNISDEYNNLPKWNTLNEAVYYIITELNCDMDILSALKDFLLYNVSESTKSKIDEEFSSIHA